jgi:hypothetical protein
MAIAIIGGTGDQGLGLALRWIKAGEKIIIGSRQDERAKAAVQEIKKILGECDVEGYENSVAAGKADIIILSVPFQHVLSTMDSLKGALTEGKILVSQLVPLQATMGGKPTQVFGIWQGSVAELVSSVAPKGVKVVSAFQNAGAHLLQDVAHPVECDVVVSSNDEEAKKTIMKLAEKIPGARGIDGGRLENARLIEPITALLIGMCIRYKKEGVGIRFTHI